MATSWDSVANSEAYQALPPDQKNAARQQYFSEVVAPNVPKEHLDTARKQFADASSGVVDNRVLADEKGYEYGNILPLKKNTATGETSLAIPEMIRSPIRGIQDLQTQAQNQSLDTSPDAVNAMATFMLPATGNIPADGINGAGGAVKSLVNDVANSDVGIKKLISSPASGGADVTPTQSVVVPSAIPSPIIKDAAQNAYKYSENVGGVLHPENFTNPVLDIIDSAKAKPIAGKVLTSEQRALNSALDEYSPLRDSPLTLDDFQTLDKSLGAKESAAMNGFTPTNNSRIIGQVQDKVRARLQNLGEGDVIGGKEGFDALTEHAIPLWSTQAKMADLEDIITRANSMDNPVTAMRTGFRNLSLNKAKMAQYPEDVQVLIRKASTNPSDILGVLGSRLNPITSGTVTGKAANLVASKAFRGIRDKMQQAKADKILSSMTNPVRDSVQKFSTLPDSPYPVKPEVPVEPANPYFNKNSGTLDKYLPNNAIGERLSPVEPANPEPQGTASMYYSKGGSVKKPSLTTQFLAKAKR